MTTHRSLLIDDEPLQLLPGLAVAFGLNEAIILQQVHYWLHPKRNGGKVVDGVRWVYNTYEEWRAQFPFWSEKSIGNAVRSLQDQGVLLSRQDLNDSGPNRRKWYTIAYDHPKLTGHSATGHGPELDHHRPELDHDGPELDDALHIRTETTSETTSPKPPTPLQGGRAKAKEHPFLESWFVEFWDLYPRKVAKADARKVYARIVKSADDAQVVLTGLRRWLVSADWCRTGPGGETYIHYPATFLNKRLFDDEPLPVKSMSRTRPAGSSGKSYALQERIEAARGRE